MTVFLYDGIHRFSVRGRTYILEGRMETNDQLIIDKLRSLSFREEAVEETVKKPIEETKVTPTISKKRTKAKGGN